MDAAGRRAKLTQIMKEAEKPVTGGELSAMLRVTRQVVVQDIALLRASGLPVIATPSGYMMLDGVAVRRPLKVFTCRHESVEEAERELSIIVAHGGRVRDVIIEHPVYGEISGSLMVSTPEAVKNLVERLKHKNSMMLTSITGGVHMHTVEAESEEALTAIEEKLKEAGLLI